ncbi:hypothetical protein Tco_0492208 [Tanacetum coccineum]
MVELGIAKVDECPCGVGLLVVMFLEGCGKSMEYESDRMWGCEVGGKCVGEMYSNSISGVKFGLLSQLVLQGVCAILNFSTWINSYVSVPPRIIVLKARSSHVATFVSAHPNLAVK